jgi:NADPH-dependent glutamate synthase beta subunit-like oxidoreductase
LPQQVPEQFDAEQRKLAEKNLDVLKAYAARGNQAERPLRIHFLFNAAPVEIRGEQRARELVLARTRSENGKAVSGGETFVVPADTIISAIGYRSTPLPGLPFDNARGTVANAEGRVEPGVYTAGWCKRGPQGVVPANRADSLAVAELIVADLATRQASGKRGGALIDSMLAQRGVQPVDFAGWQKINAAEVAAGQGRPREKLTRIEELLAAAQG